VFPTDSTFALANIDLYNCEMFGKKYDQQSFAYFDGPLTELKRLPYYEGLFDVNNSIAKWDKLSTSLVHELGKSFFLDVKQEDPFNIVNGTGVLISRVVNRKRSNDPVNTLVFLDKSARPAKYVFDCMWRKLESMPEFKKLEVVKPKIRFLNTGNEDSNKHMHAQAIATLGKIFDQDSLSGNVLVVDEYVSSGGTAKSAISTILKAGYKPRKVEAVQQFARCPSWYSQDDTKGVGEVGRISDKLRYEVGSKIDPELSSDLQTLVKQIGYKKAYEYITSDSDVYEQVDMQNLLRKDIALSRLKRDLINFFGRYKVPRGEVVSFYASNGGFTVIPPSEANFKKSLKLKQYLAKIVDTAFENKLIQFK
jgi:hypothetical protein